MSDKTPIAYNTPIDRPLFVHSTDSCKMANYNLYHDTEYVYHPYHTMSPLPIGLDIKSSCSTATGPSVVAFEGKCLEAVSQVCQLGYDCLSSVISKTSSHTRLLEGLPVEIAHSCLHKL